MPDANAWDAADRPLVTGLKTGSAPCDALVTIRHLMTDPVTTRRRRLGYGGWASNTEGMGRSVLLVEDDPRVRRVLQLALDDEGYGVREAATGRGGSRLVETMRPDVILLDLMLPDIDGFTVCRTIRRTSDVPVIMVTARTDSHDVVAGPRGRRRRLRDQAPGRQGAFGAHQGSAAPRRPSRPTSGPPLVSAGDLEIGLETRVVTRGGQPVDLTRTEFRLLAELARTGGVVCSREELLERVWGYGYFGDSRIVDVHVRRLRHKVERDPANPQRVVTVRGLGYRLAR